jgi:hypothetical protein
MKYIDLADLKLIKHIVEEGSMPLKKCFYHSLRSAIKELLLKYANKIGSEFDELEKDLLLLTTSKTERTRLRHRSAGRPGQRTSYRFSNAKLTGL